VAGVTALRDVFRTLLSGEQREQRAALWRPKIEPSPDPLRRTARILTLTSVEAEDAAFMRRPCDQSCKTATQ